MSAGSRNVVYRVRGLLPNISDSDAATVLNSFPSDAGIGMTEPKIRLVPSCYHDDPTTTAFVSFESPPSFLAELEQQPLRDLQREVRIGGEVLDINFDCHFHGFTQLYQTTPGHPIKADIIALSGLDGHAFGSWRGKGNPRRMWLQDFLEGDCPDCRTMIYGYNSKLRSHGINTMFDYCADFIQEIRSIRCSEDEINRPLILLGHSFGGLIVAQTLVKGKQLDRDACPTLRHLYDSIIGIMFFATPHGGLRVDDIQAMVGENESNPRSSLVEQIRSGSQQLKDQLEDLKNLIQHRKIISFIEMQQTRAIQKNPETGTWDRSGEFVTVLEPSAALVDLPDDTEIKIRVDANHSSIVKFDFKFERPYRNAIKYLKEFLHDAAEQQLKGKSGYQVQPEKECISQPAAPKSLGGWPETMIHRTGMTVLFEPQDPIADVILIPGLDGYPWRTWAFGVEAPESPGGSLRCAAYWPSQFLPKQCEDVRIMTFGFQQDTQDVSGLLRKAPELLLDLAKLRPLGRSIIFVAHSLGGLLVKETLRLAELGLTLQMKDIVSYTAAVLFLGTPHHGDGDGISLADMVYKVEQAMCLSPSSQPGHHHASYPKVVEDAINVCEASFVAQSATYRYRIYSFVEGISPTIPKLAAEFDRNTCQVEVIRANHQSICRFPIPEDQGYLQISRAIMFSVGDVKSQQLYLRDKCLSSLFFPELENREGDIAPALEETAVWIFDDPTFVDWNTWRDSARKSSNMIWLKGKPGSGKSTLMKNALSRSKELGLRDSFSVAGFFFTTRGNIYLQKTAVGLFRTILYDLLQQDKGLLSAFILEFVKKRTFAETSVTWHQPELEAFLQSAYSGRVHGVRKAMVYVDALDECDDNDDERDVVRELVYYFRELTRGSMIKVCFSSRHYPRIRIPDCPEIVVEASNGDDVERFINTKLFPHGRGDRVQRFATDIARRADGVFLWVILVVKGLNIDIDNERTDAELEETLRALPPKLEDLFDSLFAVKGSDIQLRKAAAIFSLILTSARPLNRHELRHALSLSLHASDLTTDPTKWQTFSDCLPPDSSTFLTSLRSYTRGLAEVAIRLGRVARMNRKRRHSQDQSEAELSAKDDMFKALEPIQFIHESVREYFLSSNGFMSLEPARAQPARTQPSLAERHHGRIQQCILAIEALPNTLNRITHLESQNNFPLTAYAINNIFYHAHQAELGGIVCDRLVEGLLPQDTNNTLNLWSKWQNIVSILDSTKQLAELKRIIGPYYIKNTTPFHFLCRMKLLHSAAEYLRRGGDINVRDAFGETPLHDSIRIASIEAVAFLVRQGADIHARNKAGNAPLYGAASSKAEEATLERLLKPILEDPSSVHDADDTGNTALHWASNNGNSAFIRILLSHGADPNAKNLNHDTPLHLASAGGYHAAAQLLLESGIDTGAMNVQGSAPLHLACRGGYGSIIARILMAPGADPNIVDGQGDAPAHLAASVRDIRPMQELALGNANINARDRKWQTPLHIRINCSLGINFLIASGANVKSITPSGHTPLQLAAFAKHGDAFTALIAAGADLNAADLAGKTILHDVISGNMGQWFLKHILRDPGRIDVSRADRAGRTPLHYAAQVENPDMFKTLLRAGADADLERIDGSGRTPIDYAGKAIIDSIKDILEARGYRLSTRFVNGTMKRVYEAPR